MLARDPLMAMKSIKKNNLNSPKNKMTKRIISLNFYWIKQILNWMKIPGKKFPLLGRKTIIYKDLFSWLLGFY